MGTLVTEKQLGTILILGKVALWKYRKAGMPFIRMGTRTIRYDVQVVLAWIEEQSNNGKEAM